MAEFADRDANRALMARFDDMQAQYGKMRAGLTDLQQRMSTLQVTAVSEDKMVTATVGARGHLVKLELDRAAYHRHDPAELAALITATVAQAASSMGEQVHAIMAEFMPAQSGAMTFLRTKNLTDLMGRADEAFGVDPTLRPEREPDRDR